MKTIYLKHYLKSALMMLFLFIGITSWSQTYELVTSSDDLEVGGEYIIAGTRSNNSLWILSSTQANNNRASLQRGTATTMPETIDFENENFTNSNLYATIVLGTSNGKWTLYDSNPNGTGTSTGGSSNGSGGNVGYLYPVSGQNYLRTSSAVTSVNEWTITIDGNNVASIQTTVNNRAIKLNTSSDIFSSYTSGQRDVYLYKKQEEASDEPVFSVNIEEISGLVYAFGNGPSVAQSFVLSGENLDGSDVAVLVDDEFEISENQNSGYSNELNLTAYDGTDKTLWVRLASAQNIGSYSGNILVSGGGAELDLMISLSGAVLAVPSISEDIFFGTVGIAFNQQIQATENPTSYTLIGSLPNGLSLDTETGIISGIPTAAGEEFEFQITATNLAGTSTAASFIISIEKGTQTISDFNDVFKTVDDASFNLTETTNAGLIVFYASSDEDVATIEGNLVTIIGLGTTTITATQVGDVNWNIFSQNITLTVTEAPVLYNGNGLFIKVTSLDDLTDGYYVVTNETDEFLMTNNHTTVFASDDSGAVSGMIQDPSVDNVWKIETNGSGKTIYNEVTEKYVGWSSGNSASAEDAPADSNRWTFTYADDKFTVNNVATPVRQLSYNSGSPRFAAYGNANQQELQFFKLSNATIWTTDNEWVNGTPAIDKDIVILGALEVTENLSAKTITVATEASVTVVNGFSLTVDGAIKNNGSFVVESGANLVQTEDFTGANTGDIQVKKVKNMKHLDYTIWSSPVAGQDLQDFSPLTLPNRIRIYNETTDAWDVTTGDFNAGRGYMFRAPNADDNPGTPYNWTGTFTGVANNGDITASFTAGIFQSFGNPYPSNINISDFHLANQSVGTLYFWTNTYAYESGEYQGNNWSTINRDGDTVPAHVEGNEQNGNPVSNGFISVGQGFVAETNGVITEVSFDNGMRTSSNAVFFRTMSQEKHNIRLNLKSEDQYINQILVTYSDNSTNDFDFGIDSKVFNYNGNSLYSLIDNNEDSFVIQGRSLPFTQQDVVVLGFNAIEAGRFSISLNSVDGLFSEGQQVFIKDNYSNTIHNLNSGDFGFVSDAGTFNNRFELVYTEALKTVTPDLNNNWIVYAQDGQLVIATEQIELKEVTVYDMLGRVVYQNQANGNVHNISNLSANGVLIVTIVSDKNQTFTKKAAK